MWPPRLACGARPAPVTGSSSTPGLEVAYGRRVTDWELKGVPVRVEIGPRDLARGVVTLVRRDSGDRSEAALADVAGQVATTLERRTA